MKIIKKNIENFIRKKLKINKTISKHSVSYWSLRGWSIEEAYLKAKDNKRKNYKSVYSKDYWLKKINPLTRNHYTSEEADFERNSRRPIKKEYWSKKGYSDIEAQTLSKEVKNRNNEKGAKKSASSIIRRVSSKRCVDYYTARGYNLADATKLVSKGQTYFSKEICIKKYGEIKGLEIWNSRQQKWQEKLNDKSKEEILRINRLKLGKGINVSKAEKEILIEIKKINSNLPVVHQFTIINDNKKQYVYDIALNKKIIEYHGDFWHCNPKKYSPDYINPRTKIKASEKWKSDFEKIKFAQDHGYEVLVIWESDYKKNKEKVLEKCIQFLTQ